MKYLISFSITVILIAFYSKHFTNSFQFDDSHTIVENMAIRSVGNIPDFFIDATTFSSLPRNQSYRPLVTTKLAIDYWLGNNDITSDQINPVPFHITSFLIFLIQLWGMYLLFEKILSFSYGANASKLFLLVAVLLYGFHAAIVETLNYIISCSEIMVTMFIVYSLYFFLRYR